MSTETLTVAEIRQKAKYALLQEFVKRQTELNSKFDANFQVDMVEYDRWLASAGLVDSYTPANQHIIVQAEQMQNYLDALDNFDGDVVKAIEWNKKTHRQTHLVESIEVLFFMAFTNNGFNYYTQEEILEAIQDVDNTHNMGVESAFLRSLRILVKNLPIDEEYAEMTRKHREED